MPLLAKLFDKCENIAKVQDWYRLPLKPCQVWLGSDFACHQGTKKFDAFLFVCHAFELMSVLTTSSSWRLNMEMLLIPLD